MTLRLPNNMEATPHSDMSTVFEESRIRDVNLSPQRESTPRASRRRESSGGRDSRSRMQFSPEVDRTRRRRDDRREYGDEDADAGVGRHSGRHRSRDRIERSSRRDASEQRSWVHSDVRENGHLYRIRGQSSPPVVHEHRPSTLRLPEFNGEVPLQSHLIKYQNAKQYYGWRDDVAVAHLKQSLAGDACNVLWSLPPNCSEKVIVEALEQRYGNRRRIDSIKFQFKCRKQAKTESVDQYFAAMLKLSQMAFGCDDGPLVQALICDQFIDGIFDCEIKMKLLEAGHKSIYDACQHALRLVTIADVCNNDRRFTRAVNVKPEVDSMALAVSKIEARLDRLSASVEAMSRKQNESDRGPNIDERLTSGNIVAAAAPATVLPVGPDRKPNRVRRCFKCGSDQHILKNCVFKNKDLPTDMMTQYKAQQVDTECAEQLFLSAKLLRGHKSLPVNLVCDSGSQVTLIPERYLKFAVSRLRPCGVKAFAATGDQIQILGSASFKMQIQDVCVQTDFLVTPDVTDALLGTNFLREHRVVLDIANECVLLNGAKIKLTCKPHHAAVRRVVAAESVSILANHAANVPICVQLSSVSDARRDWVAENAICKSAVWSPRTLLNSHTRATLQMVNVSDQNVFINRGELITEASPRLYLNDLVPQNAVRMWSTYAVNYKVKDQSDDVDLAEKPDSVETGRELTSNAPSNKPMTDDNLSAHEWLSKYDDLTEHQRSLIEEIISRADSSVTSQQLNQLRACLIKHINVFAKHKFDAGRAWQFEHKIPVKDANAPPIASKLRIFPPVIQKVIEEQIQAWEENGMVESSDSCWSSPLLAVPKRTPEGSSTSWRICVDLRNVNKIVERSQFPLNNLHDTINQWGDAEYICKIDLTQSYHSIPIEPQSRKFLAFRTKNRILQFRVVPFGYLNGGQLLCSMVGKILQAVGDQYIHAYIDDTFITCETFERGLLSLDRLLSGFEYHGLKVNAGKCYLFVKKI